MTHRHRRGENESQSWYCEVCERHTVHVISGVKSEMMFNSELDSSVYVRHRICEVCFSELATDEVPNPKDLEGLQAGQVRGLDVRELRPGRGVGPQGEARGQQQGSRAYERQSLIVTTNLPFEQWAEVRGSERLAHQAIELTRCWSIKIMDPSGFLP